MTPPFQLTEHGRLRHALGSIRLAECAAASHSAAALAAPGCGGCWEKCMAKPRALIIGGSVGGLFAAHLLDSIDWDVDVFERVDDDLASRGAGIGTHPVLREIMRRLGLPIDNSLVVVTSSYICRDRTGRLILELPTPRMMSA